MALTPGTRLGQYEILGAIGAGGMGEVYRARDTRLNRSVAIKLILDPDADGHASRRLLREARAAAGLDHPNICAIHEVSEADGRSFIVMQYVEGETLDARLRRAPLAIGDVLSIATQVADALAEAHAHGTIHRDIKPSNIMLTARGGVKVMDFGLATRTSSTAAGEADVATETALTSKGVVMGTVPYMSPEQVRGEPLDGRSDLFSFGVMLYEMVSGHHPFAASNTASVMAAILMQEPQPLARYSAWSSRATWSVSGRKASSRLPRRRRSTAIRSSGRSQTSVVVCTTWRREGTWTPAGSGSLRRAPGRDRA